MAAELQARMGIEASSIDVGGGRFDIAVDGKVIFSKNQLGRYPAPGEIVKLLRTKTRGGAGNNG